MTLSYINIYSRHLPLMTLDLFYQGMNVDILLPKSGRVVYLKEQKEVIKMKFLNMWI